MTLLFLNGNSWGLERRCGNLFFSNTKPNLEKKLSNFIELTSERAGVFAFSLTWSNFFEKLHLIVRLWFYKEKTSAILKRYPELITLCDDSAQRNGHGKIGNLKAGSSLVQRHDDRFRIPITYELKNSTKALCVIPLSV